jgi:hypothetical protein
MIQFISADITNKNQIYFMINNLLFVAVSMWVLPHFSCTKALNFPPYTGDTLNIGTTGSATLVSQNDTMLYLCNDGTGVQGIDTTGYFYILYDAGINDTGFGFNLKLHGDTVITAPNSHILKIQFIGCKWERMSEPDYSMNPPGTYYYWFANSATIFVKWLN